MVMLQATGIQKVYGKRGHTVTVLNDINIEIHRGEFVGIMGPSGAGKSTLLSILSTIDPPSAGAVTIDGDNILDMKEKDLANFRREQLGFIFQDFNLLDTLTARENISLPLALSHVPVKEIEERVRRIAELLHIQQKLHLYPYELSGGQQQRVATARAIVTNPRIIFADEPTGALDSKSAFNLLQMLKEIHTKEQGTIVMITHDPYAASFCSRVLFIKDGMIFTEICKGNQRRKQFFQDILDILAILGGGHHDVV